VAGDAAARVETQDLLGSQRNLGPEFVAFPVQQENAGAVAIQQAGGFAGNQIEQGAEVALRVHPLRDGKNGGQPFVQFGWWKRTHPSPKSTSS